MGPTCNHAECDAMGNKNSARDIIARGEITSDIIIKTHNSVYQRFLLIIWRSLRVKIEDILSFQCSFLTIFTQFIENSRKLILLGTNSSHMTRIVTLL